jgi:hypothetical protein
MGLKFFKTSTSSRIFFRSGITSACFILVGTVPSDIDLLMILVITGTRMSRHFFNSSVGIGSKRQVVAFAFRMIFFTSVSEIGEKTDSLDSTVGHSGLSLAALYVVFRD